MKFFGQPKVRRFGVSETTGKIVVKDGRKIKELCEVPGVVTFREIRERGQDIVGQGFRRLPNRPHDSDIVAKTVDGAHVSTIQVEEVFNDWLILNAVCGQGMYEHVANAHELQVLQVARKMFGV